MLSLKIGQDYLCYSFFVPPQDFEFQPPTRVMRTRAEVHADAGGNGVGMLSGNRHRWSPCIPWPPPADRGCGYFRISPSPPHSTNTNPRFLNKIRGFVVSGVLKYRAWQAAPCPRMQSLKPRKPLMPQVPDGRQARLEMPAFLPVFTSNRSGYLCGATHTLSCSLYNLCLARIV